MVKSEVMIWKNGNGKTADAKSAKQAKLGWAGLKYQAGPG